jgi:ketosteroid isomerase-like protein
MTAVTRTPEDTIRRFSALLAEGDLDAMVDLYEPDAAFAPRPGEAVTGRAAIARRFVRSWPSSRA